MMTGTANQHIVITHDVCGGKPRIAGRRITVANVAIWHERLGKSADEIATEYAWSVCEATCRESSDCISSESKPSRYEVAARPLGQ